MKPTVPVEAAETIVWLRYEENIHGPYKNEGRQKCCTCEYALTCCLKLLWKNFCFDKSTKRVPKLMYVFVKCSSLLFDLNRTWDELTNFNRTSEYITSWNSFNSSQVVTCRLTDMANLKEMFATFRVERAKQHWFGTYAHLNILDPAA